MSDRQLKMVLAFLTVNMSDIVFMIVMIAIFSSAWCGR